LRAVASIVEIVLTAFIETGDQLRETELPALLAARSPRAA
jgi:hypothetical protein